MRTNCNPSRAVRLLSFLAVFCLTLTALQAQPNTDAQGDVGIGTRTPHPSALLDLTSTSKGFLMPRMTTAQRNGITSPANGLMIFNTDEGTFQLFSNASGSPKWDTVLSTGSKAGWLTKGNTGLTDGTDNFFGTKDNVPVRFITNDTERMRLTGAGNLNISAPTAISSTLGVTGATTLGSTLGVAGSATVGGSLGVSGAGTVGGSFGVTGATTLNGATSVNSTLGVTGATTLGSTLGVTGNTTIGGTLGVTGATTLNGATSVNNTLGVTGAATFNSTITQTGTGQVTFGGNVDANNGLDVNGANLNVNSAVDIIAPGSGHTFGTAGVDATVLTIDGLANTVGSYELLVNGDARITGALSFAGFTPGSVIFAGTGGSLAQDNGNFFWNDTDNRLGIGTPSPGARLDVEESNSAIAALEASHTGNGGNAASFQIANSASTANVVNVGGNHIGNGISVSLTNASNGARGIDVTQSGVGPGVFATSAGGNAVWGITSSISAAGVIGDNTFGEAVVGRNRGGNGVGAVVGRNDSSGYGVRGFNTKNGIGVLGQAGLSGGTGVGGRFENVNAANSSPALVAATNGSGAAISTTGRVEVNNGNVSLLNSNGTAGELRLYEPSGSGSNYTALKAQAQGGDVTYTLPAADGGSGEALVTDGSGNLSWSSVGLSLPYSASASAASPLLSITQTGASNVGSFVINNPSSVASVLNLNSNGIGNGLAIQLSNASNGGRGIDVTQSGVGPGVFATSAGGNAVWGITSSISAAGVIGDNTFGEAVVGRNRGGNGVGAVVGRNDSSGYGVRGFNTKNGYGVLGQAGISGGTGTAGRFENVNAANTSDALQVVTNSAGNAARFTGNVVVNGNLTVSGTVAKGGGSFMIDHPLDPENKILYHSFVESPDMKNINDGVVILDAKGEAWVELPDWFMALNGDFRYQLTAIGAPGPGLYIAEKIKDNRFRIAGGMPGMEVSWQVTGIRHDAYAQKHRIQVEVDKSPEQRGQYLHPEAFGVEPSAKDAAVSPLQQTAKMPHESLMSSKEYAPVHAGTLESASEVKTPATPEKEGSTESARETTAKPELRR